MTARTHELKIYDISGALLQALWFSGESSMQMDLDIALKRHNVGYVDVTDCINHTTERRSASVMGEVREP